jgi:hypothetical protein
MRQKGRGEDEIFILKNAVASCENKKTINHPEHKGTEKNQKQGNRNAFVFYAFLRAPSASISMVSMVLYFLFM